MDVFYETLLDFLNALIPAEDVMFTEFQSLNGILAYFLTLGFLWLFFVRPVVKLFSKRT